jgi:hypothetical protein
LENAFRNIFDTIHPKTKIAAGTPQAVQSVQRRFMKRLLALFAATILAPSSGFSFAHLWQIQEVYTNADGTVQFVEFFTNPPASSEVFMSGSTLRLEVNSVAQNTFTFPTDLESSTLNKTLLIGTANMTALFGITPDYVIPQNFFSKGANNTLVFSASNDRVSLANLPVDGTMSLNGQITNTSPTATLANSQASATNFGGVTRAIPEPTGSILVASGLFASILFMRKRRVRV